MATPDILEKIVETKWVEIRERKSGLARIRAAAESMPATRGFTDALSARMAARVPAVIAEAKKASPSKGVIRESFDVPGIARSYHRAGATCLSILTDRDYFQGDDEFLSQARDAAPLPVLRKDFTVDPFQVYEARALGADCVLLIVSILTPETLSELSTLAVELGLDVLIEVHDSRELEIAMALSPRLIGINNRNLHTFETSLETTYSLLDQVGGDALVVTESGIRSRQDVEAMLARGVYGFLVGEAFMREDEPGVKLQALFTQA